MDLSPYTETQLLGFAKDILAKPGVLTTNDVLELEAIGAEFERRGSTCYPRQPQTLLT